MSETVITAVVTGVIALLTLIVNGAIAYFMARLNKTAVASAVEQKAAAVEQKAAAVEVKAEVKAVKDTLEITTQDSNNKLLALVKVTKDTHTLVNSNMGVQLKLGMDLSEFKAFTTQQPIDIEAARLAKEKYEDHVRQQGIVDAGGVRAAMANRAQEQAIKERADNASAIVTMPAHWPDKPK